MKTQQQVALEMMSLLIANLPAETAFNKIAGAVRRAAGDAGLVCQLLVDGAEKFLPANEEAGK